MMMDRNKQVHPIIPFVASSSTSFILAPFELASTYSKSSETKFKGLSCLTNIYKKEGLLSLWRGSGWFLFATSASRTCWLYSYDQIKCILSENGKQELTTKDLLLAGFFSGTLTSVVSNPIWTLKSFSQLPNYQGLICPPKTPLINFLRDPAKYINSTLTSENRKLTFSKRILFSGTTPAILYVSIESMFQLLAYEKLKQLMSNNYDITNPFMNGIVSGFFGGLSKSLVLPISFPLHVITIRVREHYKPQVSTINNSKLIYTKTKVNFWNIIKHIHADKAWYAGLSPYLIRSIPQSSILFFMVEGLKSLIIQKS